ncbi:MAG TPA: transposase [Oligoflexus sp.]|uniref:transposase n=1 Tax=Oligoflexus sp. TaxID=1971216 RepID=UPI002D7FAAF4|nr:transposase [Oligoflexus sp.]HET9237378.1 transposase [Oligoflexus sp.]
MGKKKDPRSYSEEFKANTVKMSLKPEVSVSHVAEELESATFPGGKAKPAIAKTKPPRKHEWTPLARMHGSKIRKSASRS